MRRDTSYGLSSNRTTATISGMIKYIKHKKDLRSKPHFLLKSQVKLV